MVGIKHESMRKGQTSHKKEHNTRMCFPLKPVFTRDKGGLPNFIDEPTTGLDPRARHDFWTVLKELCNDTLLFLSSHYMEEVQKYCDKIVYLKDGELLYAGALDKFFEQQESKDLSEIYLRISGGKDDGDVD